jgi:hypothetical protein
VIKRKTVNKEIATTKRCFTADNGRNGKIRLARGGALEGGSKTPSASEAMWTSSLWGFLS